MPHQLWSLNLITWGDPDVSLRVVNLKSENAVQKKNGEDTVK